MSDVIQLLPDSVANQIAAGEVIQRPASVIKELVENSVDAGATTINVLVVDAGRTSIQVIDNGKGMTETDARLSFERHATSKIRNAADLFSLHTMGFRGEALASIAAVAQVELRTRTADDEIGTQISIAGSVVTNQQPVSCAVGSNFTVENIFYNVPARRKFLKSNSTELNNILTAFERIALVYPDINFTFHSNNVEMLDLRRGTLRQRIIDVFGKKLNQQLIPVNVETSLCNINGFIGKPEAARKKGAHQFFFVNGRYMKHPYFHKAVLSAFERLIPQGEQIPYFLYFDVDPANIDVNIHPVKTEIKFENEQAIWQMLQASVKDSLGRFNDVPTIDFDTEGRPDIPVFDPNNTSAAAPRMDYNPQYNPFNEPFRNVTLNQKHTPQSWNKLYEGLEREQQFTPDAPADEPQLFNTGDNVQQPADNADEKSPTHYQYKGRYIMTAVKSGLMIIDQYRAHTRILYERYLSRMEGKATMSQKVLFPELVQFTPAEAVILDALSPSLSLAGFELTSLGGGSWSISGVPAGLEDVNTIKLLKDIVAEFTATGMPVAGKIKDTIALQMARGAAIPYGQVLNNAEMENLVNELFACQDVNYAPDGKPLMNILRQDRIDELFK